MSSLDDDEALFEDIYGEDDNKTTSTKDESVNENKTDSAPSAQDSTSQSEPSAEPKPQPSDTAGSSLPPPPPPPAAPAPGSVAESQTQPEIQQQQQQQQQQPLGNEANANANAMPGMPGMPGMPNMQDFGQFQRQFQAAAAANGGVPPPQPPNTFTPSNMGRESGKMFIGGLNWDTTEQGLVDYFSKYGEILDYTIMRDNSTGRSRGFGFLTFKSPLAVDEVIKTDHVLDGKLIDPKRAIARDEQDKVGKIFVGGIDPMINEIEFNEFFSQFGHIIDAQLMIDKDTGRSRGFGFITYDSPEAVDRVCVNKYVSFKGKSMEVKRAEPRGQHQQTQQQALQQQQYGFNPYGQYGQMQYAQGMNGMSPEMMQEYWQRMQQWYMYQQQQQQQGGGGDSTEGGEQPGQPLNPQQQTPDEPEGNGAKEQSNPRHSGPPPSRSYGNSRGQSDYGSGRRMNIPKGPRRAPPSGPGGSRGRGGYHNRSRGYHPYSRGGRR